MDEIDTSTRDLVTAAIRKYPDNPEAAAIAVLSALDNCDCTNLMGNGWCDDDPVMVAALCDSVPAAIAMLEEKKDD